MPTDVSRKAFGVAKEVTWGTGIATPTTYLWCDPSSEFNPEHAPLLHRGAWGNRADLIKASKGAESVKGSLKLAVEPENLGEILKAALGSETAAVIQGTGYSHKFVPQAGAQLPSLTIAEDRSALTGAMYDYKGCLVDKLTFSGDDRGRVMAAVDIIGRDFATRVTLAPTLSALEPFVYSMVALDVNGAFVNAKSWEVSITNEVKLLMGFNAGGVRIASNHLHGIVKVAGKLSTWFESTAQFDDWLAATVRNFKVTATGATIAGSTAPYKLIVDVPKVVFTAAPFGEMDGAIGVEVAFEGLYDPVASTKLIEVEIDNTRTTVY